jgi:tRNA(Leu) C34 or U34 (ribose-2'-O)-methylase TrmL
MSAVEDDREDELLEFRQAGGQVVQDEKFEPAYPAVLLIDPKFPHNVGQAVRIAACYGAEHVVMHGERVPLDARPGYRLPREERMRGYGAVTIVRTQRPFDLYPRGVDFVAVEVRTNAERLFDFEHPERAVYVFGPEDGTLRQ